MGFFKKILGGEPKLTKLLSAKIIVDEDNNFFTTFREEHSELKNPEYVRMVIHYYAKTLFNFDPDDSEIAISGVMLNGMISAILAQGLAKDKDYFQIADIDDAARIVGSSPTNIPRQIDICLYFVSPTTRHLTIDFTGNVYTQQMAFSVIALLQQAVATMESDLIEVLEKSLKYMNDSYETGTSWSDPNSLSVIPNEAYMTAIMS